MYRLLWVALFFRSSIWGCACVFYGDQHEVAARRHVHNARKKLKTTMQ